MEKIYDMIVIGGGPSGLTAGIYGGRAKLKTLIIEKNIPGGQITVTNEVVNYPGIYQTTGSAYGEILKKQALSFGTEIISEDVKRVDFSKEIKEVTTNKGTYKSFSVVIATGASPRKLGFPGEKEFEGRGIAYCATCDGEFFTGMDVFVIGAGFAAAEEAIFLTKYAKKVTVIAREPEFTCAKSIADKVLAHPKIEVKFNTEILEAKGDIQLRSAKFINNKTKEITEYNVKDGEFFGIFVFIGYKPQSDMFKDIVKLDNGGFILTDENLQTNIQGVYAAGDIRPKKLRQLVTAVSDGAEAASNIEKYVEAIREKYNIAPEEDQSLTSKTIDKSEEFLDSNLKNQLSQIAEKFESSINIVVIKEKESSLSKDMEEMVLEIASTSDKIRYKVLNRGENPEFEKYIALNKVPTITILDSENRYRGIKYSTLPSGHELNSFILAMYNIAGPGQKLSPETSEKIKNITGKKRWKIGISLSCNKCPELVQGAQRISIENSSIDVEIIDVFAFKEFKERYNIMSVPALITEDEKIYFGVKTIEELLDL
ncbi:Ferredoxin--NADP reductase [Fusobacterium sp. DD29]|uniref:FAD-dependent oxidoreductase n=1 Tax=unclassified Fusobacterium TaxID=2648384 RepID=UPI001B8D7B19|nr:MULTISPECIES: FAD-dependent oxidoreductase [unclassified Fusobacterium]MBR8701215.1 Ferredoxin--NADP reductase [Fusobacterium sp. DD45]MBR8710983.1 Ferredoxin--NADP reductase [Fusobacterium sp. DD28]MBR8748870.1 Ferredoxin--NADP reductase [Fusobacterium sp. DD29]MBR8751586.1 Ferredoxin--NADP reductase [Fusobacterium sp. DD26]MBR8761137.1 Ferredoxin--NADP reductase [Fusobacterium sp. DD25]